MDNIETFFTKNLSDYELLDTGEGEKLERLGKYTFIRPYEDAFWPKTLKKEWQNVDGKFITSKKGEKAGWELDAMLPKKWPMSYQGIKFFASPTPFRHFGFFPEQASHWDFIETYLRQGFSGQGKIKSASAQKNFVAFALGDIGQGTHDSKNSFERSSQKPIRFLNLFGYTGLASLFALRAGAEVTHVDASKTSLALAKENQKLSGLENLPMRIICEDALKFMEREIKRGNKYDCLIMDPPKFGRGPKGEIWKLENMLPKLLENARKILSDKPFFVILTSYATDSSALSLGYALQETAKDLKGTIKVGELCILEKSKSRKISLANTAIWQKD